MSLSRSLRATTLAGILALTLTACTFEFTVGGGETTSTSSDGAAATTTTGDAADTTAESAATDELGFTLTSVSEPQSRPVSGHTLEINGLRFFLPGSFNVEPVYLEDQPLPYHYAEGSDDDGYTGRLITGGIMPDAASHTEMYERMGHLAEGLPDAVILGQDRISVNDGEYEVLAIRHMFTYEEVRQSDNNTLLQSSHKRYGYDWFIQYDDDVFVVFFDSADDNPDIATAILTSFEPAT